ncbi:MAG: MerR family transcriptional regulator [Alcanivorax sp.]|nr:MAG: hypothetical protein COA68_00290 [Oceanobacter sp.]
MNQAQFSGYPIREFARLTGVNPVTLRAWERRYGIISPLRTPKGHRFYNDNHVTQVKNIIYWLEQGYPIRQVKLLLTAPPEQNDAPADDWAAQNAHMLTMACELNYRGLDDLWTTGLATYPMAVYYERCLLPVLSELRADPNLAMVLNGFNYLLKRKLANLISLQSKQAQGDAVLMAVSHEDAELQLLSSAYALGAAGYRVEFFGPNIAPDHIQIASLIVKASWVWIHIHPSNHDETANWLHIAEECSTPVYYSGAIPQALVSGTALGDNITMQVQTFITTSGNRS